MTRAKNLKEHNKVKNTDMSYHYANSNSLEIKALVQTAAKFIPPVWPLETFIACNPLQGFENKNFDEAFLVGHQRFKSSDYSLQLNAVNLQMIKWCSAFFDEGQNSIEMPFRNNGLYFAFKKLACYDTKLHFDKKLAKIFLQQLPESAEDAIALCLHKLEVPMGQAVAFLEANFAYLPGWSGYVKWHTDWKNLKNTQENVVSLTDFMAIRLVITVLLWPDALDVLETSQDDAKLKDILIKIKNNEDTYRKKLLESLRAEVNGSHKSTARKSAQLVFCIDVRSEPFRRALESSGDYETLGFAGFFGIPVRVNEFDTNKSKECCPVLLKPKYSVTETPEAANKKDFDRYNFGRAFNNICKDFYAQLKHNFSTPFALVESLGLWCGLKMVLKSFSPTISKRFFMQINNLIKPSLPTSVDFELRSTEHDQGLSLQEQITYAEAVLRLMGLISGFAKMVVFCGHGSTTENNPYASALDCGACGGNHGGMNAKLLAAILNKPEVRRGLENCGIHIPFDTIFYGALHNTTTDDVKIFTEISLKPIYPALVKNLEGALKNAKSVTNQERGKKLNSRVHPKLHSRDKLVNGFFSKLAFYNWFGGKSSDSCSEDIFRRSTDWSETRPEWGLAKNAAFIVGPRYLTKNLNLEGRCFLHSYRYDQDEEGVLLETILTAPMVVAEWINTQYLFSTLDNVAFGSGSKITHNVVGRIGVMQGNSSDLMHGLPLQSVMSADGEEYHQPQRLLTIVYAPKAVVAKVINKHAVLQTLFFNEWVHLVVIDPDSNIPYKINKNGEWVEELK